MLFAAMKTLEFPLTSPELGVNKSLESGVIGYLNEIIAIYYLGFANARFNCSLAIFDVFCGPPDLEEFGFLDPAKDVDATSIGSVFFYVLLHKVENGVDDLDHRFCFILSRKSNSTSLGIRVREDILKRGRNPVLAR